MYVYAVNLYSDCAVTSYFKHYNRPNVSVVTFCVGRRRRKMYCGHARPCVSVSVCLCVWVCLSVRGRTPTLLHGLGCNLGHGRGCPLVVHYWADLQLVHRLRCYGNITRTYSLRGVRARC